MGFVVAAGVTASRPWQRDMSSSGERVACRLYDVAAPLR